MNIIDSVTRFIERVIFEGSVTLPADCIGDDQIADGSNIDPAKLAQRPLLRIPQNLAEFVIHDAPQTRLPGTQSGDDLCIAGTSYGNTSIELKTGNQSADGNVTMYARKSMQLPGNYEAGQSVSIEIKAGMESNVADVYAAVQVEARLSDGNGGVSSELTLTAAQSINNTTAAVKTFTIDPTNLVPGSTLDVRVGLVVNDAATAGPVVGAIGNITLLCDTRG